MTTMTITYKGLAETFEYDSFNFSDPESMNSEIIPAAMAADDLEGIVCAAWGQEVDFVTMRAFNAAVEASAVSSVDELMEYDNSIRETAANGVKTWMSVDDFVDDEFFELFDIQISDDSARQVFFNALDYEKLAEGLIETADGGSLYYHDEAAGLFVARAY